MQQLPQLPHVVQRERRHTATPALLPLLLWAFHSINALLLLLLLQPRQHLLPQLLPLCQRVWRIWVITTATCCCVSTTAAAAAAGVWLPCVLLLLLLLLLSCQGVHDMHHGQLLLQLLDLPAAGHTSGSHIRVTHLSHTCATCMSRIVLPADGDCAAGCTHAANATDRHLHQKVYSVTLVGGM
jgi:hypothetical protein